MSLRFLGTEPTARVFIDDILAGAHPGAPAPWCLDITRHVVPGEIHRLSVVFARSRPAGGSPLETGGIAHPVRLVSAGEVYVEDVFVRSYVAGRWFEAEVALRNTSPFARRVELSCEAFAEATSHLEKTFGPVALDIGAKRSRTVLVDGAWANPTLWWPAAHPHLYLLRTTVRESGLPLDVHEIPFGFREVTVEGSSLRINGVRRNLWCWAPEETSYAPGSDFIRQYRSNNDRLVWFTPSRGEWSHVSFDGFLGRCDRNGVAVGVVPLVAPRPRGRDSRIRPDRRTPAEYLDHVVRASRSHPCVIVYRVNGLAAARKADPTRPFVGEIGEPGGAEIDAVLRRGEPPDRGRELNGPGERTSEDSAPPARPCERPVFVWAEAHPGCAPCVGGDVAFRGRDERARAEAKWFRMLGEGYRRAGVAGFFPAAALGAQIDGQKSFSDLAVVTRARAYRLRSGQKAEIPVRVLNDSWSSEPIDFRWSYWAGGELVALGEEQLGVEPGFGAERTIRFGAPRTDTRLEGSLFLCALQGTAHCYCDELDVPVLPEVERVRLDRPLLVLDRAGATGPFLVRTGARHERISSLDAAAGRRDLVLIGPDTLTLEQAYGPALMSCALGGGRVIVLEQKVPADGAGLPAPVRAGTQRGGWAFPEEPASAVFRDLGPEDLVHWAGGRPTYVNAYTRPEARARSLVECGPWLAHSALLEMPCGEGVIVCCQLRVGAKLGLEPAADVLLRNLLEHYDAWTAPRGIVAVCCPLDGPMTGTVARLGANAEIASGPARALEPGRYAAALVRGSAGNLGELLAVKEQVHEFQSNGGWLTICGLGPDGLDAFNALVGVEQTLRSPRGGPVILNEPSHPLAAGLRNGDFARGLPAWGRSSPFSLVIGGPVPDALRSGTSHGRAAARRTGMHPLETEGGLVAYLRGDGGVLLNQMWMGDGSPPGCGDARIVRITSVLLRNMGVGWRAPAVPGVNVRYEPVSIARNSNAYRTSRGARGRAFGSGERDLRGVPHGRQRFAQVLFDVLREDPDCTPDCILVGLSEGPSETDWPPRAVEGIEVGRSADVLFFLHAVDLAQSGGEGERRAADPQGSSIGSPEVVTYVVNYEDGTQTRIPVHAGRHVWHWLQERPRVLPGGAVAWDASLQGEPPRRGVLYRMMWGNPRPGPTISTIDVTLPTCAPPVRCAVLAITAGTTLR